MPMTTQQSGVRWQQVRNSPQVSVTMVADFRFSAPIFRASFSVSENTSVSDLRAHEVEMK